MIGTTVRRSARSSLRSIQQRGTSATTEPIRFSDAEVERWDLRRSVSLQGDRQAVTHGTRVSVTIAAKIAATTPSTARGTMPIQYAGIGSSR